MIKNRLNNVLKNHLANMISQEMPINKFLITVVYTDCSPDLKNVKIGISVLPEKFAGTALKELRKKSSVFAKILAKTAKLRKIPRFNWIIDTSAKYADEIEKRY